MKYSLEDLQEKTNNFINTLENSKGLHFMTLILAEQVLRHSKNFELAYSSVIEQGDSEGLNHTTVSFSYLDKIKFNVTISKPCGLYPKMINVWATKDGYSIDNFRVATNDVAEAVTKIIECAENKMNRVSISEIEPEAYEPVTVPVKNIEKMIKANTWEDSLEQEEVMYNLENNLYPEDYTKKVKELLNKYEKV